MNNIILPDGRSQMKSDGSGLTIRHEGVFVTPCAGFVIKTKLISKGSIDLLREITSESTTFLNKASDQKLCNLSDIEKIFINVCYHDAVTKPRFQKKLDETGNEVVGLNMPISIGKTRMCMDKAGSSQCMVVDVILSSTVKMKIKEEEKGSTSFRDVVCDVVIQGIEQKYRKVCGNLDRRYKLPKITYFGFIDSRTGEVTDRKSEHAQIAPQWVKDYRNQPMIEELPTSTTVNDIGFRKTKVHHIIQDRQNTAVETKKTAHPSYILYLESSNRKITTQELNTLLERKLGSTPNWLSTSQESSEVSRSLFIYGDLLRDVTDKMETVVVEVAFTSPIDFHSLQVNMSVYQAFFACKSFASFTVTLPLIVQPSSTHCTYNHEHFKILFKAQITRNDFLLDADVGTSQWALKQLVSTEARRTHEKTSNKADDKVLGAFSNEETHLLNLEESKNNASKCFRLDDVLPEDRFHSEDAVSMFNLDQQQICVKDHLLSNKHEREQVNSNDSKCPIHASDTLLTTML